MTLRSDISGLVNAGYTLDAILEKLRGQGTKSTITRYYQRARGIWQRAHGLSGPPNRVTLRDTVEALARQGASLDTVRATLAPDSPAIAHTVANYYYRIAATIRREQGLPPTKSPAQLAALARGREKRLAKAVAPMLGSYTRPDGVEMVEFAPGHFIARQWVQQGD